jgi:hypothetical protein
MLSAFSVLALLLAADETPARKGPPAEVTALAVDVDFVCRTRATQSLILIPKAQAQLEVPPTCPDTGADWRLSVECESAQHCSGYVRTKEGAIALVQGSRKQLDVKPIAKEHPATLDLLLVRITGQHSLKADAAVEHQPPVQVLLHLPAVTGVYTLAPPEPAALDFEHRGQRITFQAQASRTEDGRVHLQLWSPDHRPLLDETLQMNDPHELDCKRLSGICEGTMKVFVREYQRL